MKIDCTDAARDFLLKRRIVSTARLRLGIRGGKCAGYSYVVEWDYNESGAKDIPFVFGDLVIVTDPKSLVFLNGATLDLDKKSLIPKVKLINPNEATSCGCGQSFTPKIDGL